MGVGTLFSLSRLLTLKPKRVGLGEALGGHKALGVVEADEAVVYGRIVEGFRAPAPVSGHYRLLVIPGFSDGHMHPQVVDAGLVPGRRWRDSYDWLENRVLRVDEASLRADLELSSRLARLVFMRSLLEGVTMVAVTGRLEANVRAWLGLRAKPRAVFLPTVMDRRGWPSVEEVAAGADRLSRLLEDGVARIGVFVHSLRTARPETARKGLALAASLRTVLGLHLSEGVREAGLLRRVLGWGPYPVPIAAVHCTEDEELPPGVYCVSCPLSNLVLYGRTRRSLAGVHAFGSDWPLLLGTVASHLKTITRAFGSNYEAIMWRATVGGYRVYGMPSQGDFVAYDSSLRDLLSGRAKPRLVVVNGAVAVDEGVIVGEGYTLPEVESMIRDAVREALEKHPAEAREGVVRRV